MNGIELVFLGTGGGRFVTITQKRRTAGIRFLSDQVNFHVDPGPGALIYSLNAGLNPQKLNAVLVSHRHPDHYANAEVLVEAMTKGMLKKRGMIAAPSNILAGTKEKGPVISTYHQNMIKEVVTLRSRVSFSVGDVKVKATPTKHTDPETVGFRFNVPEVGEIGYTSDTEYFDGLGKEFKGVRVLVMSVMRPLGSPWIGHMTTKEAANIVNVVKPELVVATHFGMKMLYSGPSYEVKLIEETTGVPTVAAFDGMRLHVGERISITKTSGGRSHQKVETFEPTKQ